MKELFLKIWKDPVWSKIISAIIIAIGILLYNFIISLLYEVGFKTTFAEFLQYKIKIWVIFVVLIISLLVFAVITFLRKKDPIKSIYDEKSLALDVALFNKIKSQLLPYSSIRWVRTNNFAGFSFYDKKLEPYDKIEYESEDSSFEFLNPDLEKYKNELITSIKEFNSFLLSNTFREGLDKLSVPAEWELEQPERFNNAVNGIHKRAQTLASKYDEFIKQGRKTLRV